jgi:hypothetical protein
MIDELELKSKTILHLTAINPDAIFSIYQQMGFYDEVARNPDFDGSPEEWATTWENRLSLDEKVNAAQLTKQLFNYCAGWGVKDDPPESALTDLQAIGCDISTKRMARINWLRFIELDEDEVDTLIGHIMALSQLGRVARLKPQSTTNDKSRIAELEAEVEKLRADGSS